MYSIQDFNEFARKTENKVRKFLREGKDLAELTLGLQEDLFELGRNILVETLEGMDEQLRKSGVRKNNWEIVRKDETGILTTFGTIKYNRTYFKPKSGGKRKYLVDELVGLKPHDRVSADVVINVVEEAIDSSYRKGGERAGYMDEISKQAVMDKIHNLEISEHEHKVDKKRDVRILYVEADEDHVSLQGEDDKSKIAMPRLVYVHEGVDPEKSSQTRTRLKNVKYFGGMYDESEDLWLEVIEYIDKQYDMDFIETIYLSGDGASWIKAGLDWIPKSKFVLDNFHLKKYMITATAHLNDGDIYQELKDALDWPDKDMVKDVFKKILKRTVSKTKRKAVKDARRYILNNWHGIEIKADKGHELIGCSAEGHISHVFSSRLSSRPKGWSEKGVARMSKLIVYKKNGGRIYDLVMAQKLKEKENRKHELQDELIKEVRKSSESRYAGSWSSSPTVITMGKKTGLFNEMRSMAGIRY